MLQTKIKGDETIIYSDCGRKILMVDTGFVIEGAAHDKLEPVHKYEEIVEEGELDEEPVEEVVEEVDEEPQPIGKPIEEQTEE